MTDSERLIYVVATSGHRQSYLDTLGSIFALAPVSGPMSLALFRRLVAAEHLLFATLDDDMASFVAISSVRSVFGRPTAALFLRAQKCFETGRWYYPLKRHFFRTLRRLPHLTVASITPFEIAPRYAEVAHFGVLDPQYWDLQEGDIFKKPESTPLSQEVLTRAVGRSVLCVVGTLGANKGLTFLAETLEQYPQIVKHTLVAIAGQVPAEAAALATRLEAAGAMVAGRFITNPELESFYGVADMVWACYAPHYDQASGVFGRAIQFGVEPLVREGSVISAFAVANGISHLQIAYGSHKALAELLISRPPPGTTSAKQTNRERAALVKTWRRQFVERVGTGLAKGSISMHPGTSSERS